MLIRCLRCAAQQTPMYGPTFAQSVPRHSLASKSAGASTLSKRASSLPSPSRCASACCAGFAERASVGISKRFAD